MGVHYLNPARGAGSGRPGRRDPPLRPDLRGDPTAADSSAPSGSRPTPTRTSPPTPTARPSAASPSTARCPGTTRSCRSTTTSTSGCSTATPPASSPRGTPPSAAEHPRAVGTQRPAGPDLRPSSVSPATGRHSSASGTPAPLPLGATRATTAPPAPPTPRHERFPASGPHERTPMTDMVTAPPPRPPLSDAGRVRRSCPSPRPRAELHALLPGQVVGPGAAAWAGGRLGWVLNVRPAPGRGRLPCGTRRTSSPP